MRTAGLLTIYMQNKKKCVENFINRKSFTPQNFSNLESFHLFLRLYVMETLLIYKIFYCLTA